MLVNSNDEIITPPNIILEATSKRVSDFIDIADDSNNIKGNENLMQALRVFDNILEVNSIYQYIKAFFPTIGGTAYSHKFNFVDPSLYEITWTPQYIHTLSGIRHNGLSATFATSSLSFSELTYNDTHMLFSELEYFPSPGIGVSFMTQTGDINTDATNRFLMHPRYVDGKHYSDHYSAFTNRTSYDNDSSLGVYLTQRTNSTYTEARKNGIVKSTNSNISNGGPLSTDLLKICNNTNVNTDNIYTGLFGCIGVGSSMPSDKAYIYSQAVINLLKISGKL